jgi:AcrR family transcriptional regulator
MTMENNKHPGRLGRPPKQEAGQTRERLLDAALNLFATQGFAGTSMRQIAQAVGIRESAIYAHFASKEALYQTLFEQIGPPTKLISDLLESHPTMAQLDPEQVLRTVAHRMITTWDEPRARLFTSLLLREGALGTAGGSSLLLSAIDLTLQELGDLFRYWREQGLILQAFPPEHLVWELIAPLASLRFLYWHAQATEAERETGHRRAELHIDYFLYTVLSQRKDAHE